MEDANIKKLEKLLGIKTNRENYLQGFINDGLDYLLDFCDDKRRKDILRNEIDGWDEQQINDHDDDQFLDEDQKWLREKQRKRIDLANQSNDQHHSSTKNKLQTTKVKFNENIQTKLFEKDQTDDEEDEDEEEESPSMFREDIYGRTIDEKGNVLKTTSSKIQLEMKGKFLHGRRNLDSLYVPPALRKKLMSSSSSGEETSTLELKRRLQGQLNRLSEKNFSSILNEMEEIYREESRGMINECLLSLYQDLLLSSTSITGDSILSEHALLLSLLHANVGLEIGSYLIENFLFIFVEEVQSDVSKKKIDNLILFLSYLYAFHITNSKLIFDLGRYLMKIDPLNEKRFELILHLLRTVGFLLRKENPLELKRFLQEIRTKVSSSAPISSSTRFQYLIETITSLKNNDVRKLPGAFQPDRIDRLRNLYRTLIKNKFNEENHLLNVGLEDFLRAKDQGRWWIVGSAWQTNSSSNQREKINSNRNSFDDQFNQRIRQLAKEQHINTEIRKMIFGTLLTSEVCFIIE